MAAAALTILGLLGYEAVFADDEICCGIPDPLHGAPRGPDGEFDIASQAVEPQVPAGHDFSVHVRPGGDADDWELAHVSRKGEVLRVEGEKTVDGTHYFTFHALAPGSARIVLAETDGDRTMTYRVDVTRDGLEAVEDPRGGRDETYDAMSRKQLAGDFDGTVTVRRGERFAVANRYANQPGYTWSVARKPDGDVAWLERETPHTTGDPAAERQDWYTFNATGEGRTTIELAGCYRCGDDVRAASPQGWEAADLSPESERFSVTKTLTVVVR